MDKTNTDSFNKYKYNIDSINVTAQDQSTINIQCTNTTISNNVIKNSDTNNKSSDVLQNSDIKDIGNNTKNIDKFITDDMVAQNEMITNNDFSFKLIKRKINIATNTNNDNNDTMKKGITINIVNADNIINIDFKFGITNTTNYNAQNTQIASIIVFKIFILIYMYMMVVYISISLVISVLTAISSIIISFSSGWINFPRLFINISIAIIVLNFIYGSYDVQ